MLHGPPTRRRRLAVVLASALAATIAFLTMGHAAASPSAGALVLPSLPSLPTVTTAALPVATTLPAVTTTDVTLPGGVVPTVSVPGVPLTDVTAPTTLPDLTVPTLSTTLPEATVPTIPTVTVAGSTATVTTQPTSNANGSTASGDPSASDGLPTDAVDHTVAGPEGAAGAAGAAPSPLELEAARASGAATDTVAVGSAEANDRGGIAERVRSFGPPIGLVLAVVIFLIVQHRLDRRDPKLAGAPLDRLAASIGFE